MDGFSQLEVEANNPGSNPAWRHLYPTICLDTMELMLVSMDCDMEQPKWLPEK